MRDMRSTQGAFYSAEDADSEGVEGKFYLWTESEITALLGDQAEAFCAAYNVTPAGNYHDEATGRVTGRNILHLSSEAVDSSASAVPGKELSAACACLFAVREKRIRPHLDDKVITAWNGMAISAFAMAGRMLDDLQYVACAGRAGQATAYVCEEFTCRAPSTDVAELQSLLQEGPG